MAGLERHERRTCGPYFSRCRRGLARRGTASGELSMRDGPRNYASRGPRRGATLRPREVAPLPATRQIGRKRDRPQ